MIKCVILDDDNFAISVLKQLISKDSELELIGEFSDPFMAMNFIRNNKVDLLFLDIEMPEMNGTEFIEAIKDFAPLTIFTTSYTDFALKAFEYNVTGYLVKPISTLDFAKAVMKAKGIFKENKLLNKSTLFVKSGSAIIKLNMNEVNLIECIGDYVNIFANKKKFTAHSTMKSIEKLFESGNYLRVHRSYIVRVDQIEEIEDDCIFIEGKNIPIGRTYKNTVYSKLNII